MYAAEGKVSTDDVWEIRPGPARYVLFCGLSRDLARSAFVSGDAGVFCTWHVRLSVCDRIFFPLFFQKYL